MKTRKPGHISSTQILALGILILSPYACDAYRAGKEANGYTIAIVGVWSVMWVIVITKAILRGSER